MSQFFTLPTKIGQGLISNAIAYSEPLNIANMAIGDGGGSLPSPDASVTRLVNEVRRGPINQITTDPDNPNWIIVEQVLPPDVGGWTIREVGLYDTDDNLVAYGNYPETYKPQLSEGSSRTQTIRFVMEVTDTGAVTLKIDPAVVMASRKYVDDSIEAHAKSRNHPLATTKLPGFMQLGTADEAREGKRTDRVPHLQGMRAAIEEAVGDVVERAELLQFDEYSTTTRWQKNPKAKLVIVELIGGGASGNVSIVDLARQQACTGGGSGGGDYCFGIFRADELPDELWVYVGGGGARRTVTPEHAAKNKGTGGYTGASGGSSRFDRLRANGGKPGNVIWSNNTNKWAGHYSGEGGGGEAGAIKYAVRDPGNGDRATFENLTLIDIKMLLPPAQSGYGSGGGGNAMVRNTGTTSNPVIEAVVLDAGDAVMGGAGSAAVYLDSDGVPTFGNAGSSLNGGNGGRNADGQYPGGAGSPTIFVADGDDHEGFAGAGGRVRVWQL
ncbi:phage tail protein [Kushneria sp. TE3]|uniref:phage tail protein n=1 Tax=Kushneria sp. TE3 TaxID=3449832 RepID=UPI003F684B11